MDLLSFLVSKKGVVFIGVVLVVIFVAIVGLDTILLVGFDTFFWLAFAVTLLLSIGLVFDVACIAFRPVWHHYKIRGNIGRSTFPSFDAFRSGHSENPLEERFSEFLRTKFAYRFKEAPGPNSFNGNESAYINFRRKALQEVVLYSIRARSFIEDTYIRVFNLYRSKKLSPHLMELIDDCIAISGNRRRSWVFFSAIGRFIVLILTLGKIRPQKGDSRIRLGAEYYSGNQKAFIELMDEHFFTFMGEIPIEVAKTAVPEEANRKVKEQCQAERKAVLQLAETSSFKEKKKTESPKKKPPAEEKKADPEPTPTKNPQTPAEVVREVEETLRQGNGQWSTKDFQVFFDSALSRFHRVVISDKDYEQAVQIQAYRARLETFDADYDREILGPLGKSADAEFADADWISQACSMKKGEFDFADPVFQGSVCRFYLLDEKYHQRRKDVPES